MAENEQQDDYSLGYEDGLRAAREAAADTRLSYEDYMTLQSVDPGRAAEALQAGNVNFQSSSMGMRVERALLAARAERASLLGSSFDGDRQVSREEYDAAMASARERDSGFGG